MNAARHLTVRNLPEEVANALDAERRRRQSSLNQTVIDLLRAKLGVGERKGNGLESLAGDWTEADLSEFERNTTMLRDIDPEMWV